jgi:hypothetical protein
LANWKFKQNPGNPNEKKFLSGLSTQNLKNLGNPNKKKPGNPKKICLPHQKQKSAVTVPNFKKVFCVPIRRTKISP